MLIMTRLTLILLFLSITLIKGKTKTIDENKLSKSFGKRSFECDILVASLKAFSKTEYFKSIFSFLFLSVCERNYISDVCKQLKNISIDNWMKIMTHGILVPEKICQLPFSFYYNWSLTIPPKKIYNISANQPIESKQETNSEKKVLRILHLTDFHYDKDYTIGAETLCGYPLCCRRNSISNKNDNTKGSILLPASPFGEYGCDSNDFMLRSVLNFTKTLGEIDFVYMTGDDPAHNIWSQTLESQKESFNYINDLLEKFYGKDTLLFQSLGNHESFPVDSFPSDNIKNLFNISWLYGIAHDRWKLWVPEKDLDTVKVGGFYSHVISPKLKIISLNTIFCYHDNYWLFVENRDPSGQLAWLIGELLKSERIGQKVHIISHLSPESYQCIEGWKENFRRIVSRFNSTIAALMSGHRHTDEFDVIYDTNDKRIANKVVYEAPSITSFSHSNPCVRVYLIDSDSMDVLDYENYCYDINESKKVGKIEMKFLYNPKTYYNMTDLSPQSWSDLKLKIMTDPTYQKLFKFAEYGGNYV